MTAEKHSGSITRHFLLPIACAVAIIPCLLPAAAPKAELVVQETWVQTMLATRRQIQTFDQWERDRMQTAHLNELEIGPWFRWRSASRSNAPKEGNFFWDPGVEKHFFDNGRIDTSATVAGQNFTPFTWRNGTVNHSDRTRYRKCVDYFYREISSPDARTLTLYLGFSNGMKLFLNGKLITSEENAPRHCRPNQTKVELSLKKGENALLLKYTDQYRQRNGAGSYVHVLDTPTRRSGAELLRDLHQNFPRETDWLLQDHGSDLDRWFEETDEALLERAWIQNACKESGSEEENIRSLLADLVRKSISPSEADWLTLYTKAGMARRRRRLAAFLASSSQVAYIKRRPVSPSFFAYTEGQSDAQNERHFSPGSELCILSLSDDDFISRPLIESPEGVIRDPEASYDGQRLLFAWKKSDREDDYHIYELDLRSGKQRQITSGLGFADYEPVYLPSGDIIFSSTRCVQTVDCWWTEVSNLYTCEADGRFLRRLGFDQVHTISPSVLEDGSVIYTRWDYNDRGQIFPQGLFRMNADGTGQTEFYGNNSYFPTTTSHARGIPGTQRVLAVAMGHHTWQAGKLIEIDPGKGRQENAGVEMVAPRRPAEPVRVDTYGQSGELFRHPYPLNQREFLTAYVPAELNRGRGSIFGIYWMDEDGRRELLAYASDRSLNNPVLVAPRPVPHLRPSIVDYRRKNGIYYLQDIYRGPGLTGIARGAVKRLRVIGLEFRAAGVQNNSNRGPAGGALVSTPIAVSNGSWDVKKVIGDATVYPDGSACFYVPARTPLYFQALDEKGHAIQTMRSWSTLMPGESFSCVGCHEHKNETPSCSHSVSAAMKNGPEKLKPFYGPVRGFSYIREIQPIFDQHCVKCHSADAGTTDGVKASASHCHPGDTTQALCDNALPKDSNDHSIRRFTWWSHRGTSEWAQYDFGTSREIAATRIYWFDDSPQGGRCRIPESWKLLYKAGDAWQAVSNLGPYGIERDTFNIVTFDPVVTSAVRIDAKLLPDMSSGILEWQVGEDVESLPGSTRPQLNLSGAAKPGPGGRQWSASYFCLTGNGRGTNWVNWISAQSIPVMLPPYHKGAAKSQLLSMLEQGHHNVSLSRENMDKLACWIDLLVPYCGDYMEANSWSPEDVAKYKHYADKRARMEAIEQRNIQALIAELGTNHHNNARE